VRFVKIILMMTAFAELSVAQPTDSRPARIRHGHFESPSSRRVSVTALDDKLEPFYHGVASGDPTPDAVIIWTRVTPRDADTSIGVRWAVALDTGLTQVVAQGASSASLASDFTVKIDVTGLQSNTVFYYAFQAYNKVSLIGRTRTYPSAGGDHARLAIVSCSNYPAGYFNAYGAIARRNDIDAVLHLGDYIYEYSADSTSYAGTTGKQLGRMHSPSNEIVSLADYRARYSQYRLDPDLRAMHQQHPVVHVYDDHESANDSYTDGAENHQASEGDWQVRKQLSRQACREWMPTRDMQDGRIYRALRYGDLAQILMLDTRLDGRDKQIEDLGDDASAAAKASLADPNRKLISDEQFSWITSTLRTSSAAWHVLGNQVLLTQFDVSPIDTAFMFNAIGPVYSAFLRPQLPALQNLIESAFYGDVWSNYPAQRLALCDAIRAAGIQNLLVTTGDFHCSFAMDIEQTWKQDTSSVGVEFVTPSVTSPNFDENLGTQAFLRPILSPLLQTIDTTLYGQNAHLHWADLVNHGYQILDITPSHAQADWYFMKSITVKSLEESWAKGYRVQSGTNRAVKAQAQAPGKQRQDLPAPPYPPSVTLSVSGPDRSPTPVTLLSFGPLPASHVFTLTLHANDQTQATLFLLSTNAERLLEQNVNIPAGVSTLAIDVTAFAQGQYMLAITVEQKQLFLPISVKK
jgi:alkaline phosphatase D